MDNAPIHECKCSDLPVSPSEPSEAYITISDAIELIKQHGSYNSSKHFIGYRKERWSVLSYIYLAMSFYECTIELANDEIPAYIFTSWLDDVFDFFTKMEELNDILQ